ncbi:baseplate multidomain protein megatron [Paracoccus fistulariae]|uniref:Glycoside hydrolase TIM-barrel-like domain-containing protein n=1 Tax=Paracoccus fistulariae TaxID=658446 RepID=A0ABY7SKL9_9RHOB|nr:glycoside hydrolase TIM-barrel-like domain-containing protein [Paracoccus fistulariae]MDB6181514.1 glycoside hydrolase TIM-barrel-like domain-containing protein [Paracoccus fistulariae]WCR07550.1 glycoside hydrolase TIM-barrel-like domain-containing protein [Paracoccus fistulariae]
MATIVLSAVGASIGGGFGGAFLGLSGAVIGRAVGATIGNAIDQRLLGGGSKAVETGRIDRLRLQTAGEGAPIPRLWGQMRIPGHVIWASPLEEIARSEDAGGGKGSPKTRVTQISYRLSVAMALCEGRILGVGRVWADGEEIAPADLNMRVYNGGERQLPDPAIAAHEGEAAPAYRGLAYVVLEDLNLEPWGNRMPQLTFEVTCPAQDGSGLCKEVRAVALIPGTGEYSLATTPVTQDLGLGEMRSINVNTPMGGTDFTASMTTLGRELPNVGSVSLVVSWFGNDLRINHCAVKPKIENSDGEGSEMAWRAGGIDRGAAERVARVNDRPIYGGTPSDQSVIEALRAIAGSGKKAVFYPFILMDQLAGNGLPDPYGGTGQPVMPWRGRVTTSVAPGRDGTTDGTPDAVAEVEAFFGSAKASDFSIDGDKVGYHGPEEWSYRRFILHYAHLCKAAGGVDAFLIGTEMVAMTQIRGPNNSYPAVARLIRLAQDVRAILGAGVKISYAADWSEYFGHHPGDGRLFFHLDPLWAHPDIDFIGIDNYMPLSDWRDGEDHKDAHWGRIDNQDYLQANVCGGEGFDWYYASKADRDAQRRSPITDGDYDEAWVWRYKDLKSWWQNLHYNRPNGQRSRQATDWVPGSKPFWFTEYGCASLDKATNQPNKFLDAMSSESTLPWYSNAQRDDAIQSAYVQAATSYWAKPANNPAMEGGGRMVDLSRAHIWCWDARPFPAFPGRGDLWSDGPAWERGHWLNGRAGAVRLSAVVGDICREAGVTAFDARELSGVVRGYHIGGGETARAALQPLMLAHGFDVVERDGQLQFLPRDGRVMAELGPEDLAIAEEVRDFETARAAEPETHGYLRLTHVEAGADYGVATAETSLPDADQETVTNSEFPMLLTRDEGHAIAERWLAEAVVSRDTARFALPPSLADLGPGDVVRMRHGTAPAKRWRIDRVERAGAITVDAVRVEPGVYRPALTVTPERPVRRYVPPMPVLPLFMDLPLLRGDERPHAPYLAVAAKPWPGSVAAYASVDEEGGYDLNALLTQRSYIGRTETDLVRASPALIDRGARLRLRLKDASLRSVTSKALLAGGNIIAIGDGSLENWEIVQFTKAEPVARNIWQISELLRGQAGTDGIMPDIWPAGSHVVLLDGGPRQVKLPPNARGQERFWRIGPANRPPDDASYRARVTEARGIGLRPYAPCHLRAKGNLISWVRRSRVDGDSWDGSEIPLGEASETYRLRIIKGGTVLHQVDLDQPFYSVPAEIWASATTGGPCTVAVAQLSDRFGPGPFVRRKFDDQ